MWEKIKKIHFTEYQNVSSYNIDFTLEFLTEQSKLTFQNQLMAGLQLCVSLRHTTVFTHSHANTPLSQPERA